MPSGHLSGGFDVIAGSGHGTVATVPRLYRGGVLDDDVVGGL